MIENSEDLIFKMNSHIKYGSRKRVGNSTNSGENFLECSDRKRSKTSDFTENDDNSPSPFDKLPNEISHKSS